MKLQPIKNSCIFIGGKPIGVNCLKQLLKRDIKPSLVIGNLDDDGKDKSWYESLIKVARHAHLPIIKKQKVRESKVVEQIKNIHPEIIFCIGGMQIIPPEVLKIPKLGTLNIHPALLPKYRGRFSTAHAIFNGEKIHGVTMHWMNEGIDSGPIIMQKKFNITNDDTARMVYDKFTTTGSKLFDQFLNLWLNDKKIVATHQDESRATYYPKGLPGNGNINWSWSGKQIRNWIRAMTFEPFPPASFMLGNKKMIIVEENYFKKSR
ncbi:methionyl-tRNA formyltransferase [Candidatus Peregrinibacteria bacterium]|nr:methionyl-tRNA formyltransferase [Candidatus Peregrinibacteria bacterium]